MQAQYFEVALGTTKSFKNKALMYLNVVYVMYVHFHHIYLHFVVTKPGFTQPFLMGIIVLHLLKQFVLFRVIYPVKLPRHTPIISDTQIRKIQYISGHLLFSHLCKILSKMLLFPDNFSLTTVALML